MCGAETEILLEKVEKNGVDSSAAIGKLEQVRGMQIEVVKVNCCNIISAGAF